MEFFVEINIKPLMYFLIDNDNYQHYMIKIFFIFFKTRQILQFVVLAMHLIFSSLLGYQY